jgi:predicted phosphate transport protein (TIGR00153 family)
MFGKFVPREGKFFDFFIQCGEIAVRGTEAFRNMLGDLSHAETNALIIHGIEHEADDLVHRTMDLLHTTFITPLDREDIHTLISKLDDIVDYTDAASERVFLFGVKKSTPEMIALADVCVNSAKAVARAVGKLENMKNADQIMVDTRAIHEFENQGDSILRAGIARLFREEPDTRELIKLKEILELLERVTDMCEDVANVIDGIILEYA